MTEKEFTGRVRAITDRLWRTSYAILRCGADCDDALQEALLRAWRQRSGLKDERYFETWLTRILINEAKRIAKRSAHRAEPLPESLAGADTAHRALHDAILALPEELRLPLVLHYMEGYSQREISTMLHLPQTTVQWRLHSARKRIRDMWD